MLSVKILEMLSVLLTKNFNMKNRRTPNHSKRDWGSSVFKTKTKKYSRRVRVFLCKFFCHCGLDPQSRFILDPESSSEWQVVNLLQLLHYVEHSNACQLNITLLPKLMHLHTLHQNFLVNVFWLKYRLTYTFLY